MSLGVVVKGSEGVVLAADSRVTLQVQLEGANSTLPLNFDNATKLLQFPEPHNYIGAVTYGTATIGLRTAHSYLPELELQLPEDRVTVHDFAQALSDFFMSRWQEAGETGPGMQFIVAGYDSPEVAYGSVRVFDVPQQPTPAPKNPDNEFGVTWGGQLQVVSRLVHGYDPSLLTAISERFSLTPEQVAEFANSLKPKLQFKIPYQVLPLQDCVDLATFLIRTTMTAQNLSIGIRGVGGQIEVSYVTRTAPLMPVQQKTIRGEAGP